MKSYNFLIIIIILFLIFAFTLSCKINNENFSNSACVCSNKQNIKSGVHVSCGSYKMSDIYAKNVDNNIVIPQRYLHGQSDNILGYDKYTPEYKAPIYDIGEINLFNNPRTPHGYNSSEDINNNDYNRNVKA
jgi:hypothetical protein